MDVFPIILVVHILLALSLVGVILLQRSEGGALGIGGGGSGLMTGRSAGNLLTRITSIIVALFFATSLTLAMIASHRSTGTSPFDRLQDAAGAPASQPAPAAPAEPAAPAAPLAR